MQIRNQVDILPDYLEETEKLNQEIKFKFNAFKKQVSDYLLNFEYYNLYTISDKTMEVDTFLLYTKQMIGDYIQLFYNLSSYEKTGGGISILPSKPLNPLIGTLHVFMYINHYNDSFLEDKINSYIDTLESDIYFIYQDSEFKLLSYYPEMQAHFPHFEDSSENNDSQPQTIIENQEVMNENTTFYNNDK